MKLFFSIAAALLTPTLHAAVVEFAPIHAFFVSQLVAFLPEAATGLGMPGLNDKLSIPHPQNIAQHLSFFQDIQQQLATAHGQNAQEEIDRQVILIPGRRA